jgi:hypothetical protein
MIRPVTFEIDADFLKKVDTARGDVPRTRFIIRALEAKLGIEKKCVN